LGGRCSACALQFQVEFCRTTVSVPGLQVRQAIAPRLKRDHRDAETGEVLLVIHMAVHRYQHLEAPFRFPQQRAIL
jgi:hypothetical protein